MMEIFTNITVDVPTENYRRLYTRSCMEEAIEKARPLFETSKLFVYAIDGEPPVEIDMAKTIGICTDIHIADNGRVAATIKKLPTPMGFVLSTDPVADMLDFCEFDLLGYGLPLKLDRDDHSQIYNYQIIGIGAILNY